MATAKAPRRAPNPPATETDPLASELRRVAEQSTDPRVKRWLAALLAGDQTEGIAEQK